MNSQNPPGRELPLLYGLLEAASTFTLADLVRIKGIKEKLFWMTFGRTTGQQSFLRSPAAESN